MNRREFLGSSCVAAALSCTTFAHAQSTKRIGYIDSTSAEAAQRFVSSFRAGLSEAGISPDRDVSIEHQWAQGDFDRLPALVSALVAQKPDVIVAATLPAVQAAKAGAPHLPIVFALSADPVEFGLVASFNKPGGNVTGVTQRLGELGGKRLELLHDLLPTVRTIAVLANPTNPHGGPHTQSVKEAALKLGINIRVLDVTKEDELATAFTTLRREQIGALLVSDDPVFRLFKGKLLALAGSSGIPAIHFGKDFTAAGGLMSYGPNLGEVYKRVGALTAKVLKGERPSDIPVEEPNIFELVVNQKTADTLNLTIQPAIFARSDEIVD